MATIFRRWLDESSLLLLIFMDCCTFCQLNIYTTFSSVRLHELTIFFPVVVYQDITVNDAKGTMGQKNVALI
ncbi:hypothetical protein ECSTECEH250_4381 [Escherichia coli STEC_EH250]|nr:hypothetical protein ECSTECEH250_4381 [Escherichia coli STEC_EH250]KYT61919.1 hypothetical protein AML52_24920 [Escherichia coli]KYV08391.1 hypothetical protein AML81_28360 [Escherichia coli]KYV34081.1 hypothetical protein AML37_27775 [Escherichia coli]OTB51100.1 hypothetical protein AW061_22575 [Escherichia coli]